MEVYGNTEVPPDSCDVKITVTTTTSVKTNNNLPKKFALLQIYPNPFNPLTVIEYQIPATSKVPLKIYDLLGREVAILVNNEEKAAGYYKTTFNGSRFSSGV